MKLEIDIPDETAARLLRWPIPAEYCGPTLAERVAFLIDDASLHLERAEQRREQLELYRLFSLPDPSASDDDEIPL